MHAKAKDLSISSKEHILRIVGYAEYLEKEVERLNDAVKVIASLDKSDVSTLGNDHADELWDEIIDHARNTIKERS